MFEREQVVGGRWHEGGNKQREEEVDSSNPGGSPSPGDSIHGGDERPCAKDRCQEREDVDDHDAKVDVAKGIECIKQEQREGTHHRGEGHDYAPVCETLCPKRSHTRGHMGG